MLAGPSGLPETSVMRLATTRVVAVPPTVTVKGLIDTMTRYGFRRLPIVEPERESLVGLVTGRDVLDYLAGERRELLDRRYDGNFLLGLHEPARSIMTTDVYVVTPYDTVRKAVRTMFELDVGALPVVEDRDRLVGIITERDVAMDLYRVLEDERVEDLMTPDPETVEPGTTILEAVRTMLRRGFRRLPVVKGGRLQGIVTMTDVLHHVSSQATEGRAADRVEDVLSEPVESIMTEDVITVEPETDAEEAVLTMRGANVGSLVVVEGGELVGIITERDVVHAIAGRL